MASVINVTRFVRGSKIGDNAPAVRIISNTLDFSQLSVAQSDVVAALKLDAGTCVLNVGIKCLTAEGAAATVTIGDQAAVDTYKGATDINAVSTDVGAALAAPVYYKAADYITVVPSAALDAAKVFVWALVADIKPMC